MCGVVGKLVQVPSNIVNSLLLCALLAFFHRRRLSKLRIVADHVCTFGVKPVHGCHRSLQAKRLSRRKFSALPSRCVITFQAIIRSMDDYRKWHLAWAKLDALSKDLPTSVLEKHVLEFHGILNLLSEASGEDVSPFLIPGEEVKPIVTSFVMGRPNSQTHSRDKHCDRNLMERRINEVRNYFDRITPPAERPKMGF
jgi:hypothetical protein